MADTLKRQIQRAMENQIRPKLKKDIDDSLDKSVAPTVKHAEHEVVYDVVYNTTEGNYRRGVEVYGGRYIRRYDDGGLSDVRNMRHTVNAGVLSVTNDTPPNPMLNGVDYSYKIDDGDDWHIRGASSTPGDTSIARLVENGIYSKSGYGYDYWGKAKARPFTEKTVERLRGSGEHIESLRKGLSRKGFAIQ